MKGIIEEVSRSNKLPSEQKLAKTAFLSYYISMYSSISEQIGFERASVSADEIYDFMQDLKYEEGEYVPNITKEDVIFSLYVLKNLGICR
jgi:hypothetical protein